MKSQNDLYDALKDVEDILDVNRAIQTLADMHAVARAIGASAHSANVRNVDTSTTAIECMVESLTRMLYDLTDAVTEISKAVTDGLSEPEAERGEE